MEWGCCWEEPVTRLCQMLGTQQRTGKDNPALASSHPTLSVICGKVGVGVLLDLWSEKVLSIELSLSEDLLTSSMPTRTLFKKRALDWENPAVRCLRAQISEAVKEGACRALGSRALVWNDMEDPCAQEYQLTF